jgi:hypothetical protein
VQTAWKLIVTLLKHGINVKILFLPEAKALKIITAMINKKTMLASELYIGF